MDVLVLATNRPERARAFLEAWDGVGSWDGVIVVEDGPSCSSLASPRTIPVLAHVCWADLDTHEDSWIISRRDAAIKAFGCLLAAERGATRIHLLDDDCLPWEGQDVAAAHRQRLTEGLAESAWMSSVPGLRVRGLPYGNTQRRVLPAVSMGLWAGVPDLDASTALVQGTPHEFTPPPDAWVAPPHQYVPICGMNLAFRVEVLPLLYFAPMGVGQPVGRFDDIWLGLVAQRGFAALGQRIAVGGAVVHHVRASDPFTNLRREATGVALHEHLWRLIDGIPVTARAPAAIATEIGAGLLALAEAVPLTDLRGYVGLYGFALQRWADVAAAAVSAGRSVTMPSASEAAS